MGDDDEYMMIMSGVIFAVYLVFNLAWIIPNLIFAFQDIACVTIIPDGFVMNLSTWLQVDAYVRIGATSIVLMIAVMVCINTQQIKQKIFDGLFFFILTIFAFTSIWAIVGSVIFWGNLNQQGLCTGGLQNILSVIVCCLIIQKIRQNKSIEYEGRLMN